MFWQFYLSKSIIDILTPITQNLNIYPPLISSMIGLLGFLGNLFTYLQPELRSNTCCIYSLFGSIFDIINLSLNLFPKYFNEKYAIAIPWFISSGRCKLGLFLLSFLPGLPDRNFGNQGFLIDNQDFIRIFFFKNRTKIRSFFLTFRKYLSVR